VELFLHDRYLPPVSSTKLVALSFSTGLSRDGLFSIGTVMLSTVKVLRLYARVEPEKGFPPLSHFSFINTF